MARLERARARTDRRRGLSFLETEKPDVALLDVDLRGEPVTPVTAALRRLKFPFVESSSYGDGELEGMEDLAEATKPRKPASEKRLMKAWGMP